MKTVELYIDSSTRPQKLAQSLKGYNLKQGDKLSIITMLDEDMVLLIILVALTVLQQKQIDYANKVLKNIFGNKGSGEIQKEIALEYGIEVEVAHTDEAGFWQRFSKQNLSNAYGENEPEYDLSMVKEPNAGYKK
ncbi:MAG: hypothetical protein SFU87_01735 [Chitinophagaceae bacterium]|nr:hypothetical protein [Chitinophagaceae bacterium]